MSIKEQYNAKLEQIRGIEAQIEEYTAAQVIVPNRVQHALRMARIEAEELRKWGQREQTRELREAREEARTLRDRVAEEWQQIEATPVPTPADLRKRRARIGAKQREVAAFAGVRQNTVSRAECGEDVEAMTLTKEDRARTREARGKPAQARR
jgi:hypothetical protein